MASLGSNHRSLNNLGSPLCVIRGREDESVWCCSQSQVNNPESVISGALDQSMRAGSTPRNSPTTRAKQASSTAFVSHRVPSMSNTARRAMINSDLCQPILAVAVVSLADFCAAFFGFIETSSY